MNAAVWCDKSNNDFIDDYLGYRALTQENALMG